MNRRTFLTSGLLLPATSAAGRGTTAAKPVADSRVADAATRKAATDKAVWKSYYDNRRVWGYADRHSIVPGDSYNIMLSTGPSVEQMRGVIEVFRIGHHREGDRKLVWRSGRVSVGRQEVQATASALGANSAPTINDVDTEGWRSGYYTMDFVPEKGSREINVAYIVVTNPEKSGDILVQLSTNTFNAYNAWGGHSFYESDFIGERGQIVSFDRRQAPSFFEYEYYLVTWLEEFARTYHLNVDYATNFDIHLHRDLAEKYPLLISGSHNEYWSKEEFDAVHDRIFRFGKSTIFAGANTAYWQVRYADVNRAVGGEDWGRQLICYKSPDDPIRQRVSDAEGDALVTLRFRDGARRPESMLMGAAYQSYFDPHDDTHPKFAYYVSRNDLPFFEGTGYVKGESIGDILGYEWDNADPEQDGRRLWNAETSRIPRIDPKSINVLFTGSPVDVDGRGGKAEAVYFQSPAGAKVFCAGSIRWAWGLGKAGFKQEKFRTLNRNMILHFVGRG